MNLSFRRTFRTVPLLAVGLAVLSATGCDGDADLGPPTLRCGRDTCTECGMIINEAKFAASIIVEKNSLREHQLFDDVGDMFDYELTHGDEKILARYVQDFGGGGWVVADSARFILNKEIRTPMASGLVAFASEATAQRQLVSGATHTLGIAEAREVRAAHRRERFGQ